MKYEGISEKLGGHSNKEHEVKKDTRFEWKSRCHRQTKTKHSPFFFYVSTYHLLFLLPIYYSLRTSRFHACLPLDPTLTSPSYSLKSPSALSLSL